MSKTPNTKLNKALNGLGLSEQDISKVKAEARNNRSDIGKPRQKHSITWFMNEYNLTFSQARTKRRKFLDKNHLLE